MKTCVNKSHIEGYVYEHSLELKVSGEQSKNPGTQFISGELKVATDNAMLNVVSVHFTYVTAVTSKGASNATFKVLNDIISGEVKSVMEHGKENASMVRIDSAIGLNEFYSDRSGKEELVSAKRNEGGFVHVTNELDEDEKKRNTFECDIIIKGTYRKEADEEKNLPEKLILKGAIFDFRKTLLPVEFSVLNPIAMDYFEGLEASNKNPVFTKIRGRQISETVVRKFEEASAFGDSYIREVPTTNKDYVITWANPEPYAWDDATTITVAELNEAITNREIYLAALKQRQDEYKASKAAPKAAIAPTNSGFNF